MYIYIYMYVCIYIHIYIYIYIHENGLKHVQKRFKTHLNKFQAVFEHVSNRFKTGFKHASRIFKTVKKNRKEIQHTFQACIQLFRIQLKHCRNELKHSIHEFQTRFNTSLKLVSHMYETVSNMSQILFQQVSNIVSS